MSTERLRRDVELLLALSLIEPADDAPYRLTARGERALSSVT
jgi:hypothetical protein